MGKSSETTQKNEPPSWAKPLLTRGASDALKLYDAKKGYNVYSGPTQAQFSPTTLQGMNSLLAATGGGAPITNDSVFNNPAIQGARQQLADQAAQNAQQPQQPAAQGGWEKRVMSQSLGGGRGGSNTQTTYWINTATGERRNAPPQEYRQQNGGGLW